MTNSTTNIPILDDDAVREIEARLKEWDGGGQRPASWNNVRALCQTVRALRDSEARLQEQVVRLAELAETRSDLIAAKGAHVDHLQSQLGQLTKERDDYRRRLKEWEL